MRAVYEKVFQEMTERLRAALGTDDYARRVRAFCWYRLRGNRRIAPPDYLEPKWTLTYEVD